MKTINPHTGKEYKRGDRRADGFVFVQYQKHRIDKSGYYYMAWVNHETFEQTKERMRRYAQMRRDALIDGDLTKRRKKVQKAALADIS